MNTIYRKGGSPTTYRVIVPHDYSAEADHALAWAATLLASTPGTLVLLHVILVPAPPIKRMPMIPALRPTEAPDASQERLRSLAEKHGHLAELDVFETNEAGPGIVARARRLGGDLIAIGAPTKSRGRLSRAFVGSVLDYVMWNAHGPVVAVRTAPPVPAASSSRTRLAGQR